MSFFVFGPRAVEPGTTGSGFMIAMAWIGEGGSAGPATDLHLGLG